MIVGFSKHSTGKGGSCTGYLIDSNREDRKAAPPEVIKGDIEQTRKIIDDLDFKHKYTSGVLSFEHSEIITPDVENDIIEKFESLAFAGLEADQYSIAWVRHTHAGHHEMHFVTARVELDTGKSLNIKPPGKTATEHFDDFRNEINAKYGLADPNDPRRARNVSSPDYNLKSVAKALRDGKKAPDSVRALVDQILTERAVSGLIRSRKDILTHAKGLGFEIKREGKDYITISDAKSGKRWRLKGLLYARDFEPRDTIEKSDSRRKRDYSKPNAKAAKSYERRVKQHTAKRAEYNQSRYRKTKPQHNLGHVQKPDLMARPDRSEHLYRHLQRELGNDALFHEQSSRATAQRSDARAKRGQAHIQHLRQESKTMYSNRRNGANLSKRLQNPDRTLNDDDRARKAAFKIAANTREGASERIRSNERTTQKYRNSSSISESLDTACRQIKQSYKQIEKLVSAIKTERRRGHSR